MPPPLRLRATSWFGDAVLAMAGVPAPGRLPPPAPGPPHPPRSLAELWTAIRVIPRAGSALGGLRATLSAVRGDLLRKQLDQRPGFAGRGSPPPGFGEIDGIEVEPGRSPLHAWIHPPAAGRPVLFVLHGLYDSRQSGYVLRTAEWLAGLGFGVVAPDLRWHGRLFGAEHMPTLGLLEARDLIAWSRFLHARHPGHPQGLLGFSLSTLAAAHALASPEAATLFASGGVLVSPPGPLAQALDLLDKVSLFAHPPGSGVVPFLFRRLLVERMERLGLGRAEHRPFAALLAEVGRRRPLGALLTPAELLAEADHLPALARARRPLLLLCSEDDPIFPAPAPVQLAEAAAGNERVLVLPSPSGGHLGQLALHSQWFADVVALFATHSATLE